MAYHTVCIKVVRSGLRMIRRCVAYVEPDTCWTRRQAGAWQSVKIPIVLGMHCSAILCNKSKFKYKRCKNSNSYVASYCFSCVEDPAGCGECNQGFFLKDGICTGKEN